jgi:Outer membrane protein beta-barrel domain
MTKTSLITMLVTALGLAAGNVIAGEAPVAISKNPKNPPQEIVVPAVCDCFNAGPVFSIYGAGIIPDGDGILDDGLGGGLSLGYFVNENFGLEVDATWLDNDSLIHNLTASAVFRFPIKPACIAPYVFAGGGLETDSVNQGVYHVGAGIDIRLGDGPTCPGIFVDARYTFADKTQDYTIVRAGFRINL